MACGILVPQPRIEPVPPVVEVQRIQLDCQGSPSRANLKQKQSCYSLTRQYNLPYLLVLYYENE